MRGAATIKKARDEAKKRQEENSGNYKKLFILGEGETAVVRFLESGDELACAYIHSIRVPYSKMPKMIVCRDQDPETGASVGASCPGCESNDPEISKRSFRGAINVLWYDAPVFERDSENKLIKSGGKPVVASKEDQVAVWTPSATVVDSLLVEDVETPGGLVGRDWKVSRTGTGRDTKYDIRPAERDGGQKPLSKAAQKLADEKYDLIEYIEPRPIETWWGNLAQGQSQTNYDRPSFQTQAPPADVSPFMNEE